MCAAPARGERRPGCWESRRIFRWIASTCCAAASARGEIVAIWFPQRLSEALLPATGSCARQAAHWCSRSRRRRAPALAWLLPDLAAETIAASAEPTESPSTALVPDAAPNRGAARQPDFAGSHAVFRGRTFAGNGRTCGTCHPRSNNFTIDTAFIATLPANDPLFVAEFNPALAQLERPQLMRAFGLILENLDGLDDPDQQVRHAQCPAHARVANLAAAGHLAAESAGADDRLVRRWRAGRGLVARFRRRRGYPTFHEEPGSQ